MRNIKLTIEYDGKDFNRLAETAIIKGFVTDFKNYETGSKPLFCCVLGFQLVCEKFSNWFENFMHGCNGGCKI